MNLETDPKTKRKSTYAYSGKNEFREITVQTAAITNPKYTD